MAKEAKKEEVQKEKKQQKKEQSKIQKFLTILRYFIPISMAYYLLQGEIQDYYYHITGQLGNYSVDTIKPKTLNQYKTYHKDVGLHSSPKSSYKDSDFSDNDITEEVVYYLHSWSNVTFQKWHFDTEYSYENHHLGINNDYQYCQKSDILKLQEPGTVLDNYYFYNDFEKKHLVRLITKAFGVDLTPYALSGMSKVKYNTRTFDLDPKISLINSKISRVHHYHPMTTCLFCLFQSSNHIPGKWAITGKDLVVNNYKRYEQSNFKNKEECKKTIDFMPDSYRLWVEEECQAFFEYMNTDEYRDLVQRDGIVYIMKSGRDIHRGEGIELLTPPLRDDYVFEYEDGQQCGHKKQIVTAQRYIANPMLYKGNKIEIRIYFLIASTDPLIVYSQDQAHLRMCAEKYDKHSLEKEVHVCNVAVAKQGNEQNKYVINFSLEGLRDYLLEEKIITNENWVEEVVQPQIHRAVAHLARLGKHRFLKDSRVNENFAVDFLLDDQSKLWFMENNPNPQILRTSTKRVKRHFNMFGDMFEIQFKYLRARFTRLQQLSKRMINSMDDVRENPQKWKQEFDKLNKNYLDQGFEIREKNSYRKVYDESLEGDAKFMGVLPKGCDTF